MSVHVEAYFSRAWVRLHLLKSCLLFLNTPHRLPYHMMLVNVCASINNVYLLSMSMTIKLWPLFSKDSMFANLNVLPL